MIDFEIQRFSRRCSVTGRAFEAGDWFYSALVAQGADIVRSDFAPEAWSGPPDRSIGWWKSRVPDPRQTPRMKWAPHEVMLQYFQQLGGDEQQADLRYVLALLMVRRRILKLVGNQTDADRHECMILFSPQTDEEFEVRVAAPDPARAEQIQHRLAELLVASGGALQPAGAVPAGQPLTPPG